MNELHLESLERCIIKDRILAGNNLDGRAVDYITAPRTVALLSAFDIRGVRMPLTTRKLLFHVLLHEIRHWAQIAAAVRLAGFEPPGDHDLLFSAALK